MRDIIYDVIVVGAGHAGCEAALACARMKLSALLITLHKEKIAFLSCNPAIGGVGKGQLVREIDALGGEMAKAADASIIQFRMLNTSKGQAVQSSRAQVDMEQYSKYMQRVVLRQKHLNAIEGEAAKVIIKNHKACGIELENGEKIKAKTVIITTGTFLNAVMHIGMRSFPGGRIEEQVSSIPLSDSLKSAGLKLFRFKTGTCARLNGKTINFSKLKIQYGDKCPRPFSSSTNNLAKKQLFCYITYTNKKTHDIIKSNLSRSPLYSGKITGTGVRYCPSLEDKVVKFSHHDRHQIFLEPEGRNTDEFYPNGLSTSLPADIQEKFIHSIEGLEKVKINRYGYGIEYDAVDPLELYPTLEAKNINNLFLAGQINGTTGYEEAAAQGLIAGINAALKVKKKKPLILERPTSYIGVLLDDLTTKGTNEPYRMFTSRVEYRLLLREDNAALRLNKIGHTIGLIGNKQFNKVEKQRKQVQQAIDSLKKKSIFYKGEKITLFNLLKRPQIQIKDIRKELKPCFSDDVWHIVQAEVKYSGFIRRQLSEVKSFKNLEKIKLPRNIDYSKFPALSGEIREKLMKFKPMTLGQASRISGVTPVAISLLMVYLKKLKGCKRRVEDRAKVL
ncbi:MAG: tRNA uridine-5-carboxymethylaminomethyl(34) synthesis enzyme MnmG [Candidatus Omnitrophica bacterium]|nr:tRNA uridine-5-carboxymethylaminomethyl(34) synthesis enzyme MnmG [Candidatus Omnitrophota bacterium]